MFSAGFACGVFVDDKLKAVRTDVLQGDNRTYKILILMQHFRILALKITILLK
jgi:hypothetical protein